jgi:hypothetical protein
MERTAISRYYIFNPALNQFLAWDGQWVKWTGAKDFLSLDAARRAMDDTGHQYFILKLMN